MKIGMIGSGNVGQQLAIGFVRLGHSVKIGTRDTAKLAEWLSSAGENVSAGSLTEAAQFGEVLVLATSWGGTLNAIELAGSENFAGKIVVDVTNPLDFSQGVPPKLASAPGNSGAEQIQKAIPGAKITKAFNTISAHTMINPSMQDGDPVLFIAGDTDAKKFATETATGFGWKSVIDTGDLSQSYLLETFAMLWINYAFANNHWTHAFKLLVK